MGMMIGSVLGSSPLTRGKPQRRGRWQRRNRLIPAHAGKTRRDRLRAILRWAHPRSRGENRLPTPLGRIRQGSSPLTRGKRGSPEGFRGGPGLIPAHAGKTEVEEVDHELTAAHPRSRGENFLTDETHLVNAGSSPLTRGKRAHGEAQTKRLGLIPAHAGKTQCEIWGRR